MEILTVIVTAYSVIYLLMSVLSVFVGFTAVVIGLYVYRRWRPEISSEEQYSLEKKVYLVITAIVLGVFMRLVMVPLWFWMLTSFVPAVPGAMCLAGIHALKMPYSFVATGLKFFLPMVYIFWLVVNRIDRKVETQPLTGLKLKMLVPLGSLMLVEAYFDGTFLTAVKPRQVACCTSLFDMSSSGPQMIVSNVWGWYFTFYILALVIISISFYVVFKGLSRPSLSIVTVVMGVISIPVFVLALHTKISPLFLSAPFHHCVFCIWQNLWDGAIFTSVVIIGLWLALTYPWIHLATRNKPDAGMAASGIIRKLALWSNVFLISGTLLIGVQTIYELIT